MERQDGPILGQAGPPFESGAEGSPPAGLRNSESTVWSAVATGDKAICGPSVLAGAGDEVPSESEPIRAKFLYWLLTTDGLPGNRHVLRIVGATIEGGLDLEAQTIECPLDFEGCRFSEPIKVDQARLSRLALENCEVPALEARQLYVAGDLSLARSRVRWVGLLGAHIGGRLVLTDARLSNRDGQTLNANGADVGQDVLCRRLRANGEITLVGTNIAGNLDLTGASIYPMGLLAAKASIGADLKCDAGTRIKGILRLGGTQVSGLLDLGDAMLRGRGGTAVDLEEAKVGKLVLPSKRVPQGVIDLTRTRAGHLDDYWEFVPYQARVNGLVYDTLSDRAGGLKTRLRWLRAALPEDGRVASGSTSTYVPQAYEQLAVVYRREGCEHHARMILMEKERERFRRPDHKQWYRRVLSKLLGHVFGFFGYGYRWYRGVVLIAAIGVADWCVFARASSHHEMVVVGPTPHPPPFDSKLYALEAVVPLVDFGQKTLWAPTHLAEAAYVVSVSLSWLALTLMIAAITQRYVRQ